MASWVLWSFGAVLVCVCVEHPNGLWEQYLGIALPKNCLSAAGVLPCAFVDGDSLLHPSRSPWLGLTCQLSMGSCSNTLAAEPSRVDPMLQMLSSSL